MQPNEIIHVPNREVAAASVFMPVMSMEVALERRTAIVEFTKRIMVTDQDFGIIPGTNKPTLLKPGAEKLCNFFGLEPEFTPIVEDADWTGDAHKGETFYYVRYRCRLLRDGRVLGVGEGSCNSWESKYRWRQANRKCPQCAGEFIIAGKAEYGGGWLCFKKKGGCGAKFEVGDPKIQDQQVGRVPNPDVADVVNTIQKMAQKRALVAATLIATSASEFFTQDMEDSGTAETSTEAIDTGGHPVGTQAAANHVRDAKLAEAQKRPEPPPVPEALTLLVDGLAKPGGQRLALETMRRELIEAMPTVGASEYHRIFLKHGLKPTGGNGLGALRAAIIEMFALAQDAQKSNDTKPAFVASDEDLPESLVSAEVAQ